jgi:glyoxylase-like metal-dependent hydrolase (beta-lactamase superfamily II)
MADPAKLVASAGRLYGGEEGRRELWGEVIPVPEANLQVLSGGERDVEGAYRVEYTPGHASHHVSYFHEASGVAFVGDTGGARIPPHDFVIAPTPPPDVDIAAWERSIETIRAWEPSTLAITHFGEAPPEQLDQCLEALYTQRDLAAEHDQDGFVAAITERIRAAVGDDTEKMLAAAPPDQLHMGLARWHQKFG